MKDENGKLLSPCIVARAKAALGIENWYSGNNKTCSEEYWRKVLRVVVKHYPALADLQSAPSKKTLKKMEATNCSPQFRS